MKRNGLSQTATFVVSHSSVRRIRFNFFLIAIAALTIGALPSAAEGDSNQDIWPQWRGPNRDGHVGGPAWPDSLGADKLTPLWRVALGESYSGAVVGPDAVFVTETTQDKYEVVRALRRDSGEEIWRNRWEGYVEVKGLSSIHGGWIKATPAYDGTSVYVLSMRDALICLDARNGAQRWRVDFFKRFGTFVPPFGATASPLVIGNNVYVQTMDSLFKLDKHTGDVIWRGRLPGHDVTRPKGFEEGGGSSPIYVELGGVRQILVQAPHHLNGVDAETGEILWTGANDRTVNAGMLTPVLWKDHVLLSSTGLRTSMFKIGGAEGISASPVWRNKVVSYMSSMIVVGDHAYLHLKNQRMACIDLGTGDETWITQERLGRYASLVAQDDKILALGSGGDLYLLRANPERFEVIDKINVGDSTWGYLSVAGEEIYIRELNAVAAYSWK